MRRALVYTDTWLPTLLLAFASGLVSNELLLDLVGVQQACFLLVSLVDVVLVGGGVDAQEVIEGDTRAFGSFYLVAQTKDFLICEFLGSN